MVNAIRFCYIVFTISQICKNLNMAKNKKITFDKDLGIKSIKHKRKYAELKIDLKDKHLNHGGIAHGGVLASLCDIALAEAVHTSMKKDEWCVTAELNIQFLSPAFPEELIAFGKLIRKGANLAFVEGGVKSKKGTLIVKATGIWVIKKKKN